MKGLIDSEMCPFRTLRYTRFRCVRYMNLLILRLAFVLENKPFQPTT